MFSLVHVLKISASTSLFLLISLNPIFFSSLQFPVILTYPVSLHFSEFLPTKAWLELPLEAVVKGSMTVLSWGTTETWDPSVAVERDGQKSSLQLQ